MTVEGLVFNALAICMSSQPVPSVETVRRYKQIMCLKAHRPIHFATFVKRSHTLTDTVN